MFIASGQPILIDGNTNISARRIVCGVLTSANIATYKEMARTWAELYSIAFSSHHHYLVSITNMVDGISQDWYVGRLYGRWSPSLLQLDIIPIMECPAALRVRIWAGSDTCDWLEGYGIDLSTLTTKELLVNTITQLKEGDTQ
jgi:hypothetical protein